MSSFTTYLVGFLILIIGLALAAHLLGAPTTWIVVGVIVLVGVGIISATTRTRTRDHSSQGGRGPYGGGNGPRGY